MTKTEQIIGAMSALLTNAGLKVRSDTSDPFSYEDLPVIVIDAGSEVPRAMFGGGVMDWDLTVTLLIGKDGPSPTIAPETTRATAHAALYADRTLSGLAIDLYITSINRRIDEENPALGIAECSYNITYRSVEGQV